MNKTIVCYFSASGTTKNVARNLAHMINADLFEIEPVESYSDADLNWMDKTSRSSIENDNPASRPEVKEKIDLSNYNTVLIGYPIWWGVPPRIINTFIEENNLENKKIYLFATSGGSNINTSVTYLKRKYPNLNIISGKLLSSYLDNEEIQNWLT